MKELISVVIPIYKIENYIINILEAINNQTYRNIELILVNDGSPDKSIEIAIEYLSDKKIKYSIISQKNCGLSAARNAGIKASRGEWIICPDGDDYIAKEMIEKLYEATKKYNTMCAFCAYKSVDIESLRELPKYSKEPIIKKREELKYEFLIRNIKLIVPGMLLSKEVYKNILFDTNCPYDEDINFLWRLIYQCDVFAYVESDLYNYLDRKGSLMHSLTQGLYLKSSKSYKIMTDSLLISNPNDSKFIKMIYLKYKLGAQHVLAKCVEYKIFRETALSDGYRKGMVSLILSGDIKLAWFSLLYCISLRMFYIIAKKV